MNRFFKKIICALVCVITVFFAASCEEPSTAVTLTGITITRPPIKTTYSDGEMLDTSGMVVIASFSDGGSREISLYSVDKTVLHAGDTSVTVTYRTTEQTRVHRRRNFR